MPQDGLFFRVLRRFNILWLAILGLVLTAAAGQQLCKSAYVRQHIVRGLVATDLAQPKVAAPGELAVIPDNFGSSDTEYRPWAGKVFVARRFMPMPEPATPESFKDYVPSQDVNILVTDAKSGEGVWLFPTNQQVITSRDAVYEGAAKAVTQSNTDPRPVVGMVMMVTDIGKAGKAIKDTASVYLWTKQSAKMVKLFAADKVLSYDQSGAERYMILYQRGAETRLATYAVPGFDLQSDKRMPDMPK
jgi:hypothetical protein